MSTASAVNEVATTWAATVADFLIRAQRLRGEVESAGRVAQQKAQRVADIQDKAFARGLPNFVIAGGADAMKKFSAEQDAAELAVNEAREALRRFLNSTPAGFFAERDREYDGLRPEISEDIACLQKAAAEISARLEKLLGAGRAGAEASRQEGIIRRFNREVEKFNKSIPSANVNHIPRAMGISPSESIRARIEGQLLQDRNIRELCMGILACEAERRARAAAAEEARIAALVNPFLLDNKPF